MFPLSHMLKSFVKTGRLSVVDHEGKTHVFGGTKPGPDVTMKIAGTGCQTLRALVVEDDPSFLTHRVARVWRSCVAPPLRAGSASA